MFLSNEIRARGAPGGSLAENRCHRVSANVPVPPIGHPISKFVLICERHCVT